MINTEIISSVSDCDTILADANQMKSSIETRIMSLNRQMSNYLDQAVKLPSQLLKIQTNLAAFNAQLATLAPGDRREDMQIRINNLENEERAVADRIKRFGPLEYLGKSRSLAYDTANLDKMVEIITAVQDRKTALASSTAA
jgi:chaperonin cofactor prefoldin